VPELFALNWKFAIRERPPPRSARLREAQTSSTITLPNGRHPDMATPLATSASSSMARYSFVQSTQPKAAPIDAATLPASSVERNEQKRDYPSPCIISSIFPCHARPARRLRQPIMRLHAPVP
jgi:hypothetical protein